MHIAEALDETAGRTPLMCFHPTALSGDFYRDYMLEMSADRRVMAMDTPGYGRSDPPPEPQPMSELAGAAADTLDALGYGADGEGAVDVIGYHTGTFIAAELAIMRPDLVRRLVLPGIPFRVGEEREALYEQYARPKELAEDGSNVMEVWRFWVTDRHPEVSLQRGASHFVDHLQSGPYSWWALSQRVQLSCQRAPAAGAATGSGAQYPRQSSGAVARGRKADERRAGGGNARLEPRRVRCGRGPGWPPCRGNSWTRSRAI